MSIRANHEGDFVLKAKPDTTYELSCRVAGFEVTTYGRIWGDRRGRYSVRHSQARTPQAGDITRATPVPWISIHGLQGSR